MRVEKISSFFPRTTEGQSHLHPKGTPQKPAPQPTQSVCDFWLPLRV